MVVLNCNNAATNIGYFFRNDEKRLIFIALTYLDIFLPVMAYIYIVIIYIPFFNGFQFAASWGSTIYSRLKQPDLFQISQIILSYPLADCFEFQACLAGRCLCSQNINKYLNKPVKSSTHVSGYFTYKSTTTRCSNSKITQDMIRTFGCSH